MTRIASHPAISLCARSRDHQTQPIGGPEGQGPFLNGAVRVETGLPPTELLSALLQIERELGRYRTSRWGPRKIDLDLLLYGEEVIRTGNLEVPHPRMAWRRFVLAPAAEVAPNMLHPSIGWTVQQLLNHLQNARPYVAMAGPPRSGKSLLAADLARTTAGRLLCDPHSAPLALHSRGSAGNAARIELEFIRRRAELLAVDRPVWREQASLWVSDFWFGQTPAYAQTTLAGSQFEEVIERWRLACAEVVPAKLIVAVDAPPEWCAERIAQASGSPQAAAMIAQIAEVRSAILAAAGRPGLGPVLRLDGRRPDLAFEELTAAVAAMS